MDVFTENNVNGKIIDHLGLVADKIKDLKLVDLIDQRLPISKSHGSKVSHGERVSAMILNGLGFINTRLYMFPQFLQNKAVNRLFSRDIDVECFNDDALGRCLDAISAYGTTKLFTELSFCIGTNKKLLASSVHFDTSTIQVYGDYAEENPSDTSDVSANIPRPKYGHSKSHRHDLKQMVINLATTGKANFPIWMEAHSGNNSDQIIMPQAAVTMNEFCMQLKEAPSFLYVGDSAIYANILQHSNTIKWLTRVPETILQAKQLLRKTDDELCWNELGDGYKYHAAEADYGNVRQRWILIYSQHAFAKEIKTLEKSITKEHTELEKQLCAFGRQEFKCKHDAEAALKVLRKKLKYHRIDVNIEALSGYSRKGCPSADANDTIPNQLKKTTNKPSIKWVYYLFQGVQELTINIGAIAKQLVINLNATLKKIISYFGVVAQAIYLNPA